MPKVRKLRGQITKCTRQIAIKFDELLRTGINIKDCCIMLGVNLQDYYNWKNRAKACHEKMNDSNYLPTANEKKYLFFFETVNKAEVYLKQAQLQKILNHQNPQNAQWWLSRKYRAEYGDIPIIDNSKTTINVIESDKLHKILNEINNRTGQIKRSGINKPETTSIVSVAD